MNRALAEELARIEPYPGKVCGGCTACCSVVPVREVGTKAYQRCPMLRNMPLAPGCSIYPNRPRSCRNWACGWLASDWPDDLRPDRCGVIVDPAEDIFWAGPPGVTDIKQCHEVLAARLWVLRGFEDAWERDPVRGLILAILETGMAVMWDLPPGPDGARVSRVFMKTEDGFSVTPPQPMVIEPPMSQTDRYLRARELSERR